MLLAAVPRECFHTCVLTCPRGQIAHILTPVFQMEKSEALVTKHLAKCRRSEQSVWSGDCLASSPVCAVLRRVMCFNCVRDQEISNSASKAAPQSYTTCITIISCLIQTWTPGPRPPAEPAEVGPRSSATYPAPC